MSDGYILNGGISMDIVKGDDVPMPPNDGGCTRDGDMDYPWSEKIPEDKNDKYGKIIDNAVSILADAADACKKEFQK